MRSQTGNIPYPIHLHGPLCSVKNTNIFRRSASSAKSVTPEYWRVPVLVVRLVSARIMYCMQIKRMKMDEAIERV